MFTWKNVWLLHSTVGFFAVLFYFVLTSSSNAPWATLGLKEFSTPLLPHYHCSSVMSQVVRASIKLS